MEAHRERYQLGTWEVIREQMEEVTDSGGGASGSHPNQVEWGFEAFGDPFS